MSLGLTPASRCRNILDAQQQHIRSLRVGLMVLAVLCLGLGWGWSQAPRRILIDIPPDIRAGSTQRIGERLPSTVYAFAFYIFQQLNRWPRNGEVDYEERITALQHYLTPACLQNRREDWERRRSRVELRDRVRLVSEIPGRGYDARRVYIESPDSWVVYLDLQVMEMYRGEPVKDAYVRFPVRVVRYDIDGELNPFGLALDCFVEEPQRIELAPQGSEADTREALAR